MSARLKFIFAGLIIVTTMALVLPAVPVCRDMAFIDRNTGSRKGYRVWPFGWHSGSWYRQSALEAFMRSSYPAELRQDWISYAGTGRSIFGNALLRGHGRPGPILLLTPEAIDAYCQAASNAEKYRLYSVFASGDQTRIRELVDQMIEASTTTGKRGPKPEIETSPAAAWSGNSPDSTTYSIESSQMADPG